MSKASARSLRSFLVETRGNVAILFGLALIPLALCVGIAIDYGRALIVREHMQSALDSAGLAIGSWVGLSQDQMKAKAQQYFDANFPPTKIGTVSKLNVSFPGNDIQVDVSGNVPTTFMKLANIDSLSVSASSTIAVGMGTIEVALALDNSGSMAGTKISTLRTAALNLVDTLFASAQNSTKPDPVKISVVPFAASVNVGSQYANADWMDKTGVAKYNAYETECYANGGTLNSSGACSVNLGSPTVATNNFTLFNSLKDSDGAAVNWAGCVEARPTPYDTTDDAPGGATTLFVPMFAPDEPDNWTCSTSNCSYSGGSNSRVYNGAPAGSQSYNNYLPDAGTPATCTPEFPTVSAVNTSSDIITTSFSAAPASGAPILFQSTGSLPGGLSSSTTYYAVNRSGKTFKVSTSSNGSAVNLTSAGSGTIRYALAANWTCQSGDANCIGTNIGKSEESGFSGINVGTTTSAGALCKYGTPSNQATIPANLTVSGYNAGPNFLCTTKPILPLSTNKATIKSKINEMAAKGMTSIGEGAAWAWRTLSPSVPFTEGRPYGAEENQKVLVLMTDGQNTYTPNNKFLKSQYGLFGFVARGQLGTTSTNSSTLTSAMDARTLQTCKNIKAAGIIVYTVAFQIPSDESSALDLLKSCASDDEKYFAPSSDSELLNAFNAIGKDISMLRVSK